MVEVVAAGLDLVLLEQITLGNRTIGPVVLDLDVNVDAYYVAPTVILIPLEVESLNLRYGLFVQPSFGTASASASLSVLGFEREFDGGEWDLGDLYIQPLWLGWHSQHLELSGSYGFYAPIGKYRAGSLDNVGLGYSTHMVGK